MPHGRFLNRNVSGRMARRHARQRLYTVERRTARMPENVRTEPPDGRTRRGAENDVDRFLADEKSIEERRKDLIESLLREKAETIKAFDEKLAKLGYQANDGKPRRSHHKRPSAPAAAGPKPAEK
jgi:hypothetical protein